MINFFKSVPILELKLNQHLVCYNILVFRYVKTFASRPLLFMGTIYKRSSKIRNCIYLGDVYIKKKWNVHDCNLLSHIQKKIIASGCHLLKEMDPLYGAAWRITRRNYKEVVCITSRSECYTFLHGNLSLNPLTIHCYTAMSFATS